MRKMLMRDENDSGPRAHRRLPPLRALQAFEAAARHGSFTLAAADLNVTPSAISHQVQALEAFLQTTLFERRAGYVTLTAPGTAYCAELGRAFNLIAAATEMVAAPNTTQPLTISAGPGFAAKWLQPRLPRFLQAHPRIRLRLTTSADPLPLAENRYDIAICYGRPAVSALVRPLMLERVRPLCSPALVSALKIRSISDLERATLIHSANSVTWGTFFKQGGLPDFEPCNEIWLDRSTMAIEAAASGLGFILESDVLTEEEIRQGRLVAPFARDGVKDIERLAYFLVTSPGTRAGSNCRAFADWLVGAVPAANAVGKGQVVEAVGE